MFTSRFAWLCHAVSLLLVISISIGLVGTTAACADSLNGRILDPQGNRVPNARLRLLERDSGELRTAVSSAEGNYSFAGISAGDYLLEAEASSAALSGLKEVSVRGDQTLDLIAVVEAERLEVWVWVACYCWGLRDTCVERREGMLYSF